MRSAGSIRSSWHRPKTFLLRERHEARPSRMMCATVARSRRLRLGAWPGAPMTPTGDPAGRRCWPGRLGRAPRRARHDVEQPQQDRPVPRRRSLSCRRGRSRSARHGLSSPPTGRRPASSPTSGSTAPSTGIRYLEVDPGPGKGPLLVPNEPVAHRGHLDDRPPRPGESPSRPPSSPMFPRTKSSESVTFLEEDRICGYFRRRSSLCHPAAVGADVSDGKTMTTLHSNQSAACPQNCRAAKD